ncbi:hypothetical protein C8D76_10389 [Pasteurella langaaensis DSM 22999]|uniref:Enoyl-CoA hydratase n=1 Tax=Alitibacter langaaensis DSM 22999 TaxID=1122935 RepID=A0A2U0TA90_9PAST|nr:enoyl-CoA hydratase [Pasteurella langaaensis]PVX40516.1 hypothetical protein C8D76_10389 [Pasteurella langaaensis DSM 22999]
MENRVYLALYKGNRSGTGFEVWKSRLGDWLTRNLTRGKYSHCEIAIKRQRWLSGSHYEHEIVYDCYSSSIRDGGVRCKQIDIDSGKWDLIPLKDVTEQQIKQYFEKTKGKKYDWLGAIGVVLKCNQDKRKYFCSEFCAESLGFGEAWRFSPNDLSAILKRDC